jgi:hypothetical protein
MAESIRYGRGSLSPGELQAAVAEFVAAAGTSKELQDAAAAAGIPADQIERLAESLEFRQTQSITDQDIQLIISGATAALTLWKDVIRPWIRRHRGGDSVGDEPMPK